MRFMDIRCQQSITFSKYAMQPEEQLIQIGKKVHDVYWSYLYFDLNFEKVQSIHHAQMILYKVPENKVQRHKKINKKIAIIPTKDYMSVYSYEYGNPRFVTALTTTCTINEALAYTVIDITEIVKAWFEMQIENRGILLTSKIPNMYVQYAPAHKTKAASPFLRIYYEAEPTIFPEAVIDLPIEVRQIQP